MKQLIFIVIFLILIPLSCDRNMVYSDFQHIENGSWHWDNPVSFSFDVEDSTSIHNILIQLRHSTEYPLSNLYMFVHVQGPNGQTLTDTINFILAKPGGMWVGKGVGDRRELGYLYKRNTIFPTIGEYKISIEQAMRVPDLPVEEVGVRIEKVNP